MYDDADTTGGHTAGQPHSAAEMAASSDANVAANWVAYTSNMPAYRGLATVLMGSSTGGTNTTTWTDQDAIFSWDNTKTLAFAGTNNFVNWGVKVGTGSQATGRNGVHAIFGASTTLNASSAGVNKIYGGSLTARGTNSFLALQGNSSSEYMNLIVACQGTGSVANIRIGSSGIATGTFYNVDFWANTSGGGTGIISTLFPTAMERCTLGGNAMGGQLRLINQSNITIKDAIFFGSPSVADVVWPSAGGPSDWKLIRPGWSGSTKFSFFGDFAAGLVKEYWFYNTKIVDQDGNGVSGISVKLTDDTGAEQVNTTTDSDGRISFGSGLTANAVIVRDHYRTGGVYTTRDRSPFLVEINTVNQNTSYPQIRYNKDWPGITTGIFSDVNDIVPLIYASGNPTTWTEAFEGDGAH